MATSWLELPCFLFFYFYIHALDPIRGTWSATIGYIGRLQGRFHTSSLYYQPSRNSWQVCRLQAMTEVHKRAVRSQDKGVPPSLHRHHHHCQLPPPRAPHHHHYHHSDRPFCAPSASQLHALTRWSVSDSITILCCLFCFTVMKCSTSPATVWLCHLVTDTSPSPYHQFSSASTEREVLNADAVSAFLEKNN